MYVYLWHVPLQYILRRRSLEYPYCSLCRVNNSLADWYKRIKLSKFVVLNVFEDSQNIFTLPSFVNTEMEMVQIISKEI